MDNKLMLSVLVVMLSWMSVTTDATTVAPSSTSTPMTTNGTSMPMPMNGTSTTMPMNGTSTSMPMNGTSTTMPMNGTSTSIPMNGTSTTMPMNGTSTSMPMNGTSTTMPMNGTSTTMPMNGTSTSMPMNGTSMPMNATSTPMNATSTPMHNTSTSMNVTSTPNPMNNTSTPMNNTSTPTNNTSTPTNNTSTPTNNTSTAAPTTAAPSVTANITVEPLETPISRTECGIQNLCASEPQDCNPSQNSSCYFLSAASQNGTFNFGLSAESEGYIAVTLSTDNIVGNNDTTYVCANNKGNVKFFITVLNNGQLTKAERNVRSVKGKVTGKKIQCKFNAEAPNAQARATTQVSVAISTGPFNSTSGTLGSPTLQFKSNIIDLSNPNATVTNTLSNNTSSNTTTIAPNTTSHAITFQQSLMQALLISLGILGLAVV